MKYLIILLTSLFISLPSFANPSGKGIICECVECGDGKISVNDDKYARNKRKIGFIFFDKALRRYMFDSKKDIITIIGSGGHAYTTSPDSIRFQVESKEVVNGWNVVTNYLLKRKSLKLNAATKAIPSAGLAGLESTYQCKIIVGEDEFMKEIDNIQKAYQKKYNLKLKNNKI